MRRITETEAYGRLKEGSEQEIHELYRSYRPSFVRFISMTFGCTVDKAEEIYPEAFSILYFNIRKGKLSLPFKSTTQTYLNSTGWHLYHRRFLDKYHRNKMGLEHIEQEPDTSQLVDYALIQQERATHVRHLLEKMGDPCKTLLLDVYFLEKSYKELSETMKVDEGTIRKRKFDCLGKIRDLIAANNLEL